VSDWVIISFIYFLSNYQLNESRGCLAKCSQHGRRMGVEQRHPIGQFVGDSFPVLSILAPHPLSIRRPSVVTKVILYRGSFHLKISFVFKWYFIYFNLDTSTKSHFMDLGIGSRWYVMIMEIKDLLGYEWQIKKIYWLNTYFGRLSYHQELQSTEY
jgi:hypothetical protein